MSKPGIEDFKGTERFSIQHCLGSGGFGVVYQAYDRERDTLVALKTLKQAINNYDPTALYRFKHEFRSLADITHPNLVALYELMSDGELWFFTMEMVEGVNFLRYIRESHPFQTGFEISTRDSDQILDDDYRLKTSLITATAGYSETNDQGSTTLPDPLYTGASLDMDRLREAMRQLAEGICALHDSGKLHRDIKPTNVLVTNKGRVVLLDFGLVMELAPEGQSLDIIGTPVYMSPEQGSGVPLTEATDWYSTGVILYEALTGRTPFSGGFFEVITHKQRFDPIAPGQIIDGIPGDLESLCMRLLRRDPAERPTGWEVLRLLGETGARKIYSITGSSAILRSAPFIGRELHLSSLNEAFQVSKQGRAITVYVRGRSGIGKSALVRRFLDHILHQEPDTIVLAGRCYEQESVPYKAFDSLVDALSRYLKHLPQSEADALMPRDVLALARLFPVLRQVRSVLESRQRSTEIPDSQELRRRGFAALRELLARIADRKALILFIDDLQWGDADSAALISELLCPPDPPTLLLIGAYRSEETESSVMLKMLSGPRPTATPTVEARELVVEELSSENARELAQLLLAEQQLELNDQAETIARESGGSPFFISELVRYSQLGDGAKVSELRLEEVIQGRISQLSSESRHLLALVAVAGQPLTRAACKRAIRLGDDENKVMALLRTSHMIRITGTSDERIETYHDRIRETVVSYLSQEELKAYHQSLALALESLEESDPERLAVHFKEAGDSAKAAHYAAAAAEQASEALAFNRAARLYKLAIELRQTEDEVTQALRVKLGDALAKAGRSVDAARIYLAAVEGAKNEEKIELQRRAAEQFLFSNHIDEGLAVIRPVLEMVDLRLPETPKRALLSYLIQRGQIWLRGLKFREREASQIPTEDLLVIDICWSVAMGLAVVDLMRGADFQARHLLLALRAGEPYRIARALALEAGYSAASGGRTRQQSEKLIQMAMALAKRIKHPYALSFVTLQIGAVAFFEGRVKKAVETCEQAEEMLRETCTGVAREIDNCHNMILFSLYFMGRLKELSSRLPAVFKEVKERGEVYGDAIAWTRLSGITFLMADQITEARQNLRQTEDRWSNEEFQVHHYHNMIIESEIELYSGDGTAAWKCITEHWHAYTRSLLLRVQCALIESSYTQARCALAAAASAADPEPLFRVAEKDAGRIERENMPWGTPMAKLIRAGLATFRGEIEKSISLLALAETGFEAADMALHAEVARRRRGQLLGGEQGRALVEAADKWMAQQMIKNPERMADMFAPGRWEKLY
jgi:eukaryotic-like serine/threonine-protein kinase